MFFRFAAIAVLLLLTACEEPMYSANCVDADDFGDPKVNVSATREKNRLLNQRYLDKNGQQTQPGPKDRDDQVAAWQYTRYIAKGSEPLVLKVTGRWSSWAYNLNRIKEDALREEIRNYLERGDFRGLTDAMKRAKQNPENIDPNDEQATLIRLLSNTCKCGGATQNEDGTTTPAQLCPDPTQRDAPFGEDEIPCWFVKACGLYALVVPVDGDDYSKAAAGMPDIDKFRIANNPEPPFKTYHLGYMPMDEDGVISIPAPARGRLYFKIQDKYYNDNQGGYQVRIKSGVIATDPGIIQKAVDLVKKPILVAMEGIYTNVVSNSMFKNAIQASLVMYIIFSAIGFMFGIVQATQGQLLWRLFKFGIVSLLISDASWNIFYNHFYVLFLDGTTQLMSMFGSAAASLVLEDYAYNPKYPFAFIDMTLKRFFSPETMIKSSSLIFYDPLGLIYFLLLLASFIFYALVMIKAVLVYLMSVIAIAMCIIVGPIFMTFSLFGPLQDLFKSWVRSLVAYALQPILLFALLGLITSIILFYLYNILGYRVCWLTWWKITIPKINIHIVSFKYFLPDLSVMKSWLLALDPNGHPLRLRYLDSCLRMDLTPAEVAAYRHEFPYWDPKTIEGCKSILKALKGDFIRFWDVLALAMLIALTWKFVYLLHQMAVVISSNIGSAKMLSATNPLVDRSKRRQMDGAAGSLMQNAYDYGKDGLKEIGKRIRGGAGGAGGGNAAGAGGSGAGGGGGNSRPRAGLGVPMANNGAGGAGAGAGGVGAGAGGAGGGAGAGGGGAAGAGGGAGAGGSANPLGGGVVGSNPAPVNPFGQPNPGGAGGGGAPASSAPAGGADPRGYRTTGEEARRGATPPPSRPGGGSDAVD